MHSVAIEERLLQIQKAADLLQQMLNVLQSGQHVKWEDTINFIKVINKNDAKIKACSKENFSAEGYKRIGDIWDQVDSEYKVEYDLRWEKLMAKFAEHKNEDPTGATAQELASEAWDLITEVWGDNMELAKNFGIKVRMILELCVKA